MQKNSITPITELGVRAPEAGRIRLGSSEPSGRGKGRKPVKLKTFRFTSRQQSLITAIAGLYGGTARPWAEMPGQWEVTSTIDEIPVILLPGGLSQDYELWNGGALARRCDGIVCSMPEPVSDFDYQMVDHPCVCARQGFRECALKTRIQVIIPSLKFAGVWRLETGGFNAAEELPGMFEMITRLNAGESMIQALLGMEERTKVVTTGRGAQTRRFMVPRLGVDATVPELVAGMQSVAALTAGGSTVTTPALPSGPPAAPVAASESETASMAAAMAKTLPHHEGGDDDGIEDGEIVDDELLALEAEIADCATYFGVDSVRLTRALIGTCSSTGELDRPRLKQAIRRMRDGEIVPLGFKADGRIQWQG